MGTEDLSGLAPSKSTPQARLARCRSCNSPQNMTFLRKACEKRPAYPKVRPGRFVGVKNDSAGDRRASSAADLNMAEAPHEPVPETLPLQVAAGIGHWAAVIAIRRGRAVVVRCRQSAAE